MITLHTGKLGVGKSYTATVNVWKKINEGIDCYVNWRIDFTDYYLHRKRSIFGLIRKVWNKLTFGNEKMGKVYFWKDLTDLYGIQNGELYFDEAHAKLNSRDWQKIPEEFVRKITQSRKYGLNMHFITQHQGQVDIIVRRIANDIVIHRKVWLLMLWKEWDGEAIEILSNPSMPQPKSQGFGFHIFSKRFAKSYNTFELFEAFEPYKERPMWDADKVSAQQSATAGRSVVDRA